METLERDSKTFKQTLNPEAQPVESGRPGATLEVSWGDSPSIIRHKTLQVFLKDQKPSFKLAKRATSRAGA